MKVALVHDYLTEYGGAERVLEVIRELYPNAPVHTSMYNHHKFKDWDIRPSKISTLPMASKLTKSFTFFMPLIFENLDLRDFDVIISDGTIWSKGVLTTPEQLHIFYAHTPPRWLWGLSGETDRRRLWFLQPILKPLDNWLRIWDFETAQRPDFIVANSKTTARRIKKFWRREAKVIYPPVDVKGLTLPKVRPLKDFNHSYFLVVSRLAAYKNIDLAISACNKLKLPLKIVGVGREEERLRKLAGPTVEFLGFVDDDTLAELYQNCRALIHTASSEDFGLAPVEAMAYGKPVIALRSGGVTETVVDGKTGLFFDKPTTESLIKAIERFNNLTIDPDDCRKQAAKFSKERFQKEFRQLVEEKWHAKMGSDARVAGSRNNPQTARKRNRWRENR
jgi:glycosyltransferase involved in cell wall biosynthesis